MRGYIFFLGPLCVMSCVDSKSQSEGRELLQPPCPPRLGMIGLKLKGSDDCYWIDARPVTRGSYYSAQQAGFDTPANEPMCAGLSGTGPRVLPERTYNAQSCGYEFDDGYEDDDPAFVSEPIPWPPPKSTSDDAMQCLSWCDVSAYCAFQGKRLCNNLSGASPSFAQRNDPTLDEWYNACTAGGARKFPYGNEFIDGFDGFEMEGPYKGLHRMAHWRNVITESGIRTHTQADPCTASPQETTGVFEVEATEFAFWMTYRCCADRLEPAVR